MDLMDLVDGCEELACELKNDARLVRTIRLMHRLCCTEELVSVQPEEGGPFPTADHTLRLSELS